MPLRVRVFRFFVCILLILLALFVIVYGAIWFVNQPRFAIRDVKIVGKTKEPIPIIRGSVASYFESPLAYLFDRQTVFTASRSNLAKTLEVSFPRLTAATVDWDHEGTMTISLSDREPVYIWKATATSTDEYDVDSNAFVFAIRKHFAVDKTSSTSPIAFVGGIQAVNPIGKYALSKDMFSWFLLVKDEIAKIGVYVKEIEVGESGDLTLYTTEGWKLMINKRDDNRTISQYLKATLSAVDSEGKVVRSDLEYVDMRFPKKAYFRFYQGAKPVSLKNEPNATSSTSN